MQVQLLHIKLSNSQLCLSCVLLLTPAIYNDFHNVIFYTYKLQWTQWYANVHNTETHSQHSTESDLTLLLETHSN